MRRLTRSLIALTFCSLLPAAGGHASHALSLAAPPSAIVDVNVVTMDVDAVLPRQTVIIAAGRIVALGPVDTVAVPEVDGRSASEAPADVPVEEPVHEPSPEPEADPEPTPEPSPEPTPTPPAEGGDAAAPDPMEPSEPADDQLIRLPS